MKKACNSLRAALKILLSLKIIMVMRIIFFLSVFCVTYALAENTYSQDTRLSLDLKNVTVETVLDEIESKSEFYFALSQKLVDVKRKVNLSISDKKIEDVLDQVFDGTDVKYIIMDRQIVLFSGKYIAEAKSKIQPGTISGTVTDIDGLPLVGVTVIVKGTSIGAITDVNGTYKIQIPDDAQALMFSFVGMISKEVIIDNQSQIDVTLMPELISLEEVVVIGYGTMKKKDLTGAISTVSNEDINSLPVASLSDALQGRAAGLQVISSGVPGTDATFRIRGIGTINDNNPLFVIDGFPTSSGLNQINMNDIETIQVLKDASAAAIYGSRGANGVVIITTKRGSSGHNRIDFNYNYGVQNATSIVDVLDASEFAALHNEMMQNTGLETNPAYSNPDSLTENTDWLGEYFNPATMNNVSLSYSGGNNEAKFYISGNIFDQKGIVMETGFKRYALKFNLDTQVLKKVKFGNSLSLSHDYKYSGDYSIKNAMLALPTQAIYNEDGTYAGPEERPSWDGDITNPIGKAKVTDKTTKGYNILGSIYSEIELLNDLKFKTTLGLQANFWDDRTWAPKYNWEPSPQELSYLFQQLNKSINWNWDNTLTYSQIINDIHQVTIMGGTSAQENRYEFISGSVKEFASELTQQMSNGISQMNVDGNANEWALLSFMGRVNYGYDDKYLITATIRRDGSSRFGSENKWGTFPSASVAWRISKENFFSQVDLINDLKLRAGYGVTGNQNIGNYSFASALSTVVYNFNNKIVSAVVPTEMPNPYVQWESQIQSNIGLDATLLGQRISISIDGYIKNTENMLVPMSVPVSTGYSDVFVPFINAGKIQNKGIELTLSSNNLTGNFSWNTDFNFSYNKNVVKSLNDSVPMPVGTIDFNYTLARIAEGHPVNEFYGFITDGIFQTDEEVEKHAQQVPGLDPFNRTSAGDIRFMDLNSDGIIDDDDRTYIGNPNPKFIFALNNTFSYKGFDLNIFIQGVAGNKIFNANRIWNEGMAVAVNQSSEVLERWTGPNTSNIMPRAIFNDPNGNIRVSDRYIEDGSYLRIKNICFGYNFPKNWIQKIRIQAFRIYVSGSNLYTFTKYTGFDPEVLNPDVGDNMPDNGIDNNIYPVTRTMSMGINLSF